MRVGAAAAIVALMCVANVRSAWAQAWVSPARTGDVTFVAQEIDHVGRLIWDGTRLPRGKAINFAFAAEIDYAFTDRFSISAGVPFIMSKYTDPLQPPSPIPFNEMDSCRCFNNSFADFAFAARYNLFNHNYEFVLTPSILWGVPSHAYEYSGEAVVGRRLPELGVAVDAGQRLDGLVPGMSVQAGYRYTIVRDVQGLEIPNNRSNGSVQVGFVLPHGFSARSLVSWQRTHGGLDTCDVFKATVPAEAQVAVHCPPVDEPASLEVLTEFHRLFEDNYLHLGAGASYSRGAWEVSGSFLRTARGTNSHDVHVFSLTVSHAFEIHR